MYWSSKETGLDLGGVQGFEPPLCHFNLHYLFALVCKSVVGLTTNCNLLEVLSAYTCAPAAFSLLVKPTTSARNSLSSGTCYTSY